jgi:hypothetical protein
MFFALIGSISALLTLSRLHDRQLQAVLQNLQDGNC